MQSAKSLEKMPGGKTWKSRYDAKYPGQFQVYSPYTYDAVMVFANVALRFLTDHSILWVEEVSRYLMIWSSFLAASYALWQGEQLGMEFVVKLLPDRGRRAVRILTDVLCIGFLAVIAYQGFVWMMPQQLDQISPSLGITMAIPYAAIPVSAVLMIWVEVLFIWRELRGKETPPASGTEPLPL